MEPPALVAGPAAPVRAAPGASADLVLPPSRGTQPITYHWSRAGASLDDRFTTSADAGGVRLTVSAAQTGDSGVYTLQASNAAGSDTSKIRLEVSAEEAPTGEDPPSFLRRLQDLTVKVGSRTRFLVEIISSTECKVTWYRNERRLLEAERVALARDGNFWCADVAAVSVDDAGRWTCTAENAGGRASCSAHLNVLVPKAYKRPEFVEELRALLTEQGTVSLECKVVGVPTPVLRWFKDSREIKAGDVFALTANAEDPTSLGTYTCEAVNCMGRAYSSSKVHVVGRASREGSARPSSSGMTPEPPPIFTKELEGAHVKVCEHLSLGCHIVVPPWPRSVVWYNKEGKVEPGERYHVLEDGVGGYLLEIPSTEWADEGEWKCVATSAGGRVGISTCYVTMDVPKNYRKPRFMENLQAVLTEEGLVSFECKVVGFPTPVLSWFKDGQELKPGDVYQLTGTNSLGSYCCIARNCMGQASSSAELTVEDIQNQLNEEEKLQLFSKNQAPKYLQGLKSVEAKIDEPFRFTVKVAIPPEPSVLWYRDDQPVDESTRCHLEKEEKGIFNLDIQNLEFLDQAEWKCVAVNDFGHSVTSCFLKLIIPRHYKKPRFLENLQAILSDEGAVNLECKVIGVPQPVLKWYKDGEELKPGDIHRIISGQDGTCCLGTYTCEAQNCMGIAASSASLLGFDDSIKTKKKVCEEQPLQRNLSLSTIHEERTSQMYDTPVGDITLDDKGEISFSFDGKEVSVSLYETPDLTEEEALQIVEMYADQLSENVTEHNVVELPPLRFVKETSTSGNLLMEAIIIDVSPDYFAAPEEDLRTEADVEDLSIADENGIPQLSLDQEIEIGGENYLEKTMAILSEEKSDFAAKSSRRKSDSQRSADDFFSLSRDLSLSEEKRDDDTHISESELQSFASARSSAKVKSKSSKPSGEEGQESSEPTKTILMKEQIAAKVPSSENVKKIEQDLEGPVIKPKRDRRSSRGSRRSSTSSEKSISKSKEEVLRVKTDLEQAPSKPLMGDVEFKNTMNDISSSLTKVINDVQLIERDIILKSELMSSAATASRSLEIISSLISPLSEIHSIADAARESISESREVTSSIFISIPQPLKSLQQSLTIIEKCIDMESDNKTLVKKTCVAFVETCGLEIQKVVAAITSVTSKNYIKTEDKVISEIDTLVSEMSTAIKFSTETIKARNLLTEASEIKPENPTQEIKHLRDTQKAVYELKCPLNSLLRIVKSAESGNILNLSNVKHSEVIMNDMSASIQDLQSALEQIETLSVKESSSSLNKYNTEVIETVMDPVLKLRGSFEQLSTGLHTEEDKYLLTETLSLLQENLTEISHKIEAIDKNIGQFDILQSENKLDVLQKMAQILIALENNLPRLETLPIVKSHMATFHKNLTKILEKVIESNDAKKYQTMMEICHTVNIINSSIKNLDSENILPLASLSNTLKIIQTSLTLNIFESELNSSIVNNISDVLVGIQEAINKAEEMSLQIDSEHIQEFSAHMIDEAKVSVLLEHIDNTIAAVNTIKVIEITQELKLALMPALENISPILEELRRSVASVRPSGVEQDEHISEISEASFAETIATPLCELNQNIIILNQLIIENIGVIKENIEIVTAIAEPLQELHTNLEILQQDVISQYGDDLTPYEVSINMASVVQNLHSCIVMIHEQIGIEGAEDMSTLEDISGIKSSADALPSDRLVLPAAEETVIEQSLLPFTYEIATTATAQTLQTLNEHIMVLQTPDVIEALDTLSEISDYSSLKSIMVGLGDLHIGIEGILHPVPIEGSMDLIDKANISKLAAIAEPMQEIQQSLSILDSSNIPVYENIQDLPVEKIQSVFQNIDELKKSLEQCMCAVLPAMEFTDNTIEISNKVSTLREVCEQLKEIFDTSKHTPNDETLPEEVKNLETVVNSLIDATDVSKDIKIDQVKCITEELYLKVLGAQEDIIQFTTQSPKRFLQEAKLIHMVSEVEKSIAVLEQYDFIDLSRISDITTCMTPQIAAEINSESLAQIHDIAENAVNVLQDSYKEIPIADLMIVEDFFKTCKNEFTILRCLISKATSHKKIIRLLQEFKSLQTLINSFTTKRLELRLSDDVNECLTNFMIHADECLRNARISLIKIVDSQSDMLIKTPITQLESINELKYITKSKTNTAMASVIKSLCDVVDTSKCFENTLQIAIVEELSQPNLILRPSQEEIVLMGKMDNFAITVEAQSESEINDESSLKVLDKLKNCIYQHHDYKDASGIGKALVILKCLAECASILQEEFTEKEITKVESEGMKAKENSLKEVLSEMLQPLQALQTQLVHIQEQILSGAEEDSISIDISTTQSIMQTMTELHKDIVQQIEMDKQSLHSEDNIFMIQEVDKEIHSIQHSVNSIENVQGGLAVKEITKPIEEIEKSLHTVLSENDTLIKETLPKDVSTELLHHIDQYIELIEIVEEISAVVKVEDVKETFKIARKLKENIVTFEDKQNEEKNCNNARAEQYRLAQMLQTALFGLQVQVLDSAHELDPTLSANGLQRIAQVTEQLQANLVVVTGIHIPVQATVDLTGKPTPIDTTQSHFEVATRSETVVVNLRDSESFEPAGSVAQNILEDHNIMQTDMIENITEVTQDTALAVDDTNLKKRSDLGTASLKELANVKSFEVLDIVEAQASQIDKTETELCSIEIVHPKISTVPEITIKKYSENVNDSQALKTLKQSNVALLTVQVNLMQHITEYVSEDIVKVVNEISSAMNAEKLRHSLNTAQELKECIATTLTDTNEETNKVGEMTDHDKQQLELAQSLEVALSILSKDTLENLHELVPSFNKDTTENIAKIVDNLKTDLAFVKIYLEDVLKFANVVQQEFETKSKPAKLITKDVAETLQQAQLLTEDIKKAAVEKTQSNTAENITLTPVESTSKMVLTSAPISTNFNEGFIETPTVVQEILSKQDEQASAEECETGETNKDVTVKHTSSKKGESDIYTSEETLKIEIDEDVRQETCAEEISHDAMLIREVNPFKTASETAATGESTAVREEVTTSKVLEQKLTQDNTGLDLIVVMDEKADQVAASSELVSKVDYSTDSFQILSDATTVAAEPSVSELMEPRTTTSEKNVPLVTLTTETSTQVSANIRTERSNLIQEIDAFLSDEITEIINEMSNISKIETLKESVTVAKKLHESVMGTDYGATAEETNSSNDDVLAEQVRLAQTLQDALSLWHTQELNIEKVIAPSIVPDAFAKVSKIILNLQDSLTSAIIVFNATPQKIQIAKIGEMAEIEEQNSMVQLEKLLQDVNMKINIAHVDKTKDIDDLESLQDTLDEVQTVIIKLKREYDGVANDTLNETLDDLECSVRSVQLQISEDSPPELLTEACETLHLLVDNMNATQQAQITPRLMKFENTEIFLEKCSNDTEATVKLLDMASKVDTKGNSNLENIVSNLKKIKDSLKLLRESFLVDADTVIENGVLIIQSLNQVEELIFSLDGEIDMADGITGDTRDCIISAVHSVYGSISNMRCTVSSVQKRFMFDNYGKPSESLLHSIKNVATISSLDGEENRTSWIKLSKSLRKVLNHFEDIKFYINLDKTARLPSDAAFTKIILEEFQNSICTVLVPRAILLDSTVIQKICVAQKCVETHLKSIESDSSLQVKNKIPMFKSIAAEMLTTTNFIKCFFEKSKDTVDKANEETQPLVLNIIESLDINQELQTLAVAIETKLEEPNSVILSEISRESYTASIDEKTASEIVEVTLIEENVPSTSYLAMDDASNISRQYLPEAEILVPLEKQVLIAETMTEMNISETIKDDLTNLEDTKLLDAKNLSELTLQSIEVDEQKQSQSTADIQNDNISDMSNLQATIEQKDKLEKVTKMNSQTDLEHTIAESSSKVETDNNNMSVNTLDSKMQNSRNLSEIAGCSNTTTQLTQIQEPKTSELKKGDEVTASSSKANTMSSYEDQVQILNEQELLTNMERVSALQETQIEKEFLECCVVEDEHTKIHKDRKQTETDEENHTKQEAEFYKNAKEKQKELDEANHKQNQEANALKENTDTSKEEQDAETKELETRNQITKIDSEAAEEKAELKQTTEETIAKLDLDVTELKQKQKEKECAVALQDKQDTESKQQEELTTPSEISDTYLREEDNLKSPDTTDNTEKAKTEFKQETEKNCARHEMYDTELKQAQAEKEHAIKVDVNALRANQDTELEQKEEADLTLSETADDDTNQKLKQELSSKDAKIDKEAERKVKLDTELQQRTEDARTRQEWVDADSKHKQEESARVSQEKTDALQAKQDSELKQKEGQTHRDKNDDEPKEEKKQEHRAITEAEKELTAEENCGKKEMSDVELNNQQEEIERASKDQADKFQTTHDTELKLNKEEEALVLREQKLSEQKGKETAEADLKKGEKQEVRAIKDKNKQAKQEIEAGEKAKKEADLKLIETEARAEQERNYTELKQKQEEKERALKEEADAFLAKQDDEQQEKTRLVKEAADADLKEKEEQAVCATIEQNKKAKEDKKAAEKAKQEEELKLKEGKAREEQEINETELRKKHEEKERAMKEESDALQVKQDAEQQEAADADLKETEEQAASAIIEKDKKAKQDKKAAEKTKQEADLKLKEAKAREEQERNDTALKKKQEEKERALKEESDALQAKQDAKQQEAADADFKETEEQAARAIIEKDKIAKEDKRAAEKAKQEADLKLKEEQERNDAELEKKQEEKERALKKESDALQVKQDAEQQEAADADFKETEEQAARAIIEKDKKAKEDKRAAEKAKQEADLKLKEAKAREQQERNDTELKNSQEEKERALKEDSDALQAKQDAKQQEKNRLVKEAADADLKEKEEQAARAIIVKDKMAEEDKRAAEKAKQEDVLKLKEAKAREKQERNDTELKKKQEEQKRALKEESDALQVKQDAEQQEAADADLKETEEQAARAIIDKDKKAKEDKKAAEKAKQEADLKLKEAKAREEQERNDTKQKKKQEEKERALKEEADAFLAKQDDEQQEKTRLVKKAADADLKEKEEQAARAIIEKDKKYNEDQKAAEKAKQEADLKLKETKAREEQERNDTELKKKQEENELALKEESDALQVKQDAEQQEKTRLVKEAADANLKEKEEQAARTIIEKDKKAKEDLEAAEKAKQEDELKLKEAKAREKQERNDTELKKKQEEQKRALKEESDALQVKQDAEQQEKNRLVKEAADADLKEKEEQAARAIIEKDKKANEDKKVAEKAKQEADLKLKEEQKINDIELEKKQEEKERALKKESDALQVKQDAEQQEKTQLVKEAPEADLKEKGEQTARAIIEKDKKAKENKRAAEKAKEEADLKLKETKSREEQERNDTELKKRQEEKERALKEELDALQVKQDAEQQEKTRLDKEAANADIKEKEEQAARAIIEKDKKAKEDKIAAEKAKQEADLKLKEEQKRNDIELKKKQEEKERALKEESDALQVKQDAEQQEKNRLVKEAADADLKEKEEQAVRAIIEKDKKENEDKKAAEKAKQEADLKLKEAKAREEQERNDAELKKKQEGNELALKEESDALQVKQDAEQQEKTRLVKEAADADLKEKEEQAARAFIEKDKKANEDKKVAEKAKQEADLKLKETKAREEQERNDTDQNKKRKEKERALKEVADALQAKKDAEQQEKTRLVKEAADADVKEENEQEARATKDKAKKAKVEKETAEKAKQEAEVKQKEEAQIKKENEQEEARANESKAKKNKKDQETAEKAKKELELNEEERANQDRADFEIKKKQKKGARDMKEEADASLAKPNAELTLKESNTDVYLEEKEKQVANATKDKPKKNKRHIEAVDKAKMEATFKQKAEKALALEDKEVFDIREKEEQEPRAYNSIKLKQDAEPRQKEEADCVLREKTDIDEKQNEEKVADKKKTMSYEKERVKEVITKKRTQTENKEINLDEVTKKTYSSGISKKTDKYTERLHKSERRDDEIHIYKEDPDRLAKKENGDVYHKIRPELSQEQHYIREYQYEPSQTSHKLEAKEKPRFVDHNHRDYTMEFARPSCYREKSFDVHKTDSLGSHDYLGKNAAIYRAQTLVLDSQLRSSTHLFPDPCGNRTSEPLERRSEIRHRSKAHSEARSITSDKRTGLSRDSKRKPVFSTYLTDRTAVEGSRVKLTCSVLSSSDPTVTWYKNGVKLDNKLKYRTKFMDGLITMEVLNAVPSDSAEYSCTIENENGAVNSSASLKVYPSFEASPIPPTFTRSIRDTYHLAENELVLECRIRGQPLPTITWLKDDKTISNNSRYQAYYLADGVCRLAIEHPSPEDSGKYTCKAENSVWSDQITHVVNFTGKESRLGPNVATIEKSRFNRQAMESRRPHFTNVLSDYKVATGGTIGLQVEIRGAPTRVEWLREGCSVTEVYRNAKTFVEQGLYTLALSDVTEKESGMYTCRAWSSQCHVDMNAAITVVQPNELDGKPAIIVGRPEKDILISVGEDINISFRVQGEPKPKVVFMKGIRDITTSQRVCKMSSDDYVKFTLKRSVVSDAGTYCILARNAYGCDRAFVTVVVRQRASSDNLISDWTYPSDDSTLSIADRKYKSVPDRIPGAPCVVEGGNNWISLGWPKSEPAQAAPVLAYKVESWLLGKEGGARWVELGITPLNSFDAFNLKQGEEYHFRVTPRNRYGWGESVQTSSPAGVGLAGDRPEFAETLPGQLKVLVGETANLSCSVKGTPAPEVVWMKNGHEIEDEDRRLSSSFNGIYCSLTIKDINVEDEARYSCEATNLHGRASTYARLAVVTDRSIWEADAKLKRERSADVEGDYPPQFTMRLRDRRVQATYPVRLTCQVIGSPDPRITWFKDGGEVMPDNRRSHFQDEHFHTLEIAPTTLEDGGVYEAMARNSSGAVSCRCSLVVDKGIRAYVAPEFCCGLEPLYRLTDGEELRISAVVEAYPSVGVTWYRDGVRLRPSRRAIMTLDRDGQIELALAAVTSRDAGVYSCTASNEVGRASTSGKVEVIGTNVTRIPPVFISPDEPYSKEPMFIRKPRSSEAREGDTVIIACEVVGDPKPDVYWLRDFLKPDYYRDSSHFKRMGDGPEYRFEIPHAKLDYTGAYSVVARNQHGEAKAVISLQILAKDPTSSDDAHNVRYGLVEVLPRFSKELTDLLSCDGDAVEFECHVSGHPEPHVRWFHYNELIRDSPDFETVFDEEIARLKVKQVTAEDEGTYTCEAANNLGKVTSSACLVVYPPGEPNTLSQRLRRPPAFLSAASTPRSTPRSTPARSVSRTPGPETRRLCSPARTLAPSFYTYPFNKVAEEGDSVTLQCAIKGNPAPWATWDKDGVIITPSSRITIKEKDDVLRVLEIDEVTIDDVGVYRITIENEFGRQEASARIEVITQKGKFYAGVRAVSPSPRKSLTYRGRRPSTPRQD